MYLEFVFFLCDIQAHPTGFASRRVESILQNLRRGISKAARAAGARLADEDISVSNAAAQVGDPEQFATHFCPTAAAAY